MDSLLKIPVIPVTEFETTDRNADALTDFTEDSISTHYSRSSSCSSGALSEESLLLPDSKLEGKINLSHDGESRFNRCLATLSGHVGVVSCLAASGELLFSASQAKDVRVWRQPDLHQSAHFGAGDGAVKAIVVVGDRVVTAHQDEKLRVWKRSDGKYKMLTAMPTVKDYVTNAVSQSNYVQTRRNHRRLWIEHADAISCLAVGVAVGRATTRKATKKSGYVVLYTGSWDRTFKVWRLTDFKCLESTRAHDDAINALVVGPGGFLYTASADCKVKAWAKPRGAKAHRLVATLEGHTSSVNALAVAADGGLVYSGGSDRAIVAWETESGASRFSVACEMRGHHGGAVLSVCTVGELLCSGSADKTVRVWRREGGGSFVHSTIAILRGHQGPVKCIAGSADVAAGFLVYSGSVDGTVKVWWVAKDGRQDRRPKAIGWV